MVQISSLVPPNSDKSQAFVCVSTPSSLPLSQKEGGRREITQDSASPTLVRGVLGILGVQENFCFLCFKDNLEQNYFTRSKEKCHLVIDKSKISS